MTTITQTLTTLPSSPNAITQTPSAYAVTATAFAEALPLLVTEQNTLSGQINTVAGEVNANSSAAAASAVLATAAAGAELWVSGHAYVDGEAAISGIDYQAYRANTNTSGTTDPSASADWTLVTIGAPPPVGFDLVAAASASTTLTSDKTLVVCTPTNYGMTVKMADATTCTVGSEQARIQNDSGYHIRITNNADTLLGFVPANSTASIVCESISTAAGEWSLLGAERVGISGALYSTVLTGGFAEINSPTAAVDMDGDLEIVIFKGTSSFLYAVAFRKSTGAFGAPLLVKNANQPGGIVKHTATTAVAAYYNSTSQFGANVLTVNTSTLELTLGAQATFSLPTNRRDAVDGDLVIPVPSVPNSFVMPYDTASGNGLVAFSVSGTTITFGAGVTLTGTSQYVRVMAEADKVIAVSYTNSTAVYVTPYTLSGNTLSVGTGSSTAHSDAYNQIRMVHASAGKWWVILSLASSVRVLLATLSSTTITSSLTGTVLSGGVISDAIVVNSTKLLVTNIATTSHANIVRDVSGTATAGTAATMISNATALGIVSVLAGDQVVLQGGYSSGYEAIGLCDCSGDSPVYVRQLIFGSGATNTTAFYLRANAYLQKSAAQLYAPDGLYSETCYYDAHSAQVQTFKSNGQEISRRFMTYQPTIGPASSGNGRAATTAAAWSYSQPNRQIFKLECA